MTVICAEHQQVELKTQHTDGVFHPETTHTVNTLYDMGRVGLKKCLA